MENWKSRLLSIDMTVSNDISLHAGFMESINSIEDLMIHVRAKYNGACNVYYEISAYPISCFFSWHIDTELGHHHRARQKNMLCTVVMKVAVGNLMLFLYSQTSYLRISTCTYRGGCYIIDIAGPSHLETSSHGENSSQSLACYTGSYFPRVRSVVSTHSSRLASSNENPPHTNKRMTTCEWYKKCVIHVSVV